VVGNGTEGEPASAKDQAVLTVAPHLVLDGLVMAATAVGADRAILCVDRTSLPAVDAVRRALGERSGRDAVTIELAETPPRYTTGEETALVSWLNGGMAKPAFAPPRPYERGVDGRPTLVDNVETLAHIALIARFGADAYRQVGDPNEPGTALLTVAGAAHRRGVLEVETGTALSEVLDRAGAASVAGVLVGGYFGTWLTPAEARSVSLSNGALRSIGASMGCGLVAVLPEGHCPLQEVSDVLGWLASSSAGQCGACVNGLPALAGAFQEIALVGDRDATASGRLDRWAPMIAGRGACKLPDGAIRFMESARRVFADHLDRHRLDGPCPTNKTAFLPTPRPGEWR
jgi:NADH:ubiquinone oxidoreductase subunit F (NADH-binding)